MPNDEIRIRNGQHWRHKERGTTYEIFDINSHIQVSTIDRSMARMLEGETWVAYHDIRGRGAFPLCFRMVDEFLDGRFVLVKEAE